MASTRVRTALLSGLVTDVAGECQVITKHCGYELFLTKDEIRTNCTISFYRQRVEQVRH
jgi:hypothetical protein